MTRTRLIVLEASFLAACVLAPTAAPSAGTAPAQANCESRGGTFIPDGEITFYQCFFLTPGVTLAPNDIISARALCEHLYGGGFVFSLTPTPTTSFPYYACLIPEAEPVPTRPQGSLARARSEASRCSATRTARALK